MSSPRMPGRMDSEDGRPTLDPEHPMFGLGYARPTVDRDYERLEGDAFAAGHAQIAEETPVALVYNGWPHVVMMCTPADIEDFALGFTLTEEIVRDSDEVGKIEAVRYSQGIEVAVEIPHDRAEALAGRGRALVGRTGCGLCGVTTIKEMLRLESTVPALSAPIAPEALWRAAQELPAQQRYNEVTGAVHAAAWARPDGSIALVREDVGRHNALDKLIGAMRRGGLSTDNGFAFVTSRASYELVQKCAVAGVGVLAAISRPTGLAVRMAEASGIGLIALVRGRSANVYTHPERLRAGRPG